MNVTLKHKDTPQILLGKTPVKPTALVTVGVRARLMRTQPSHSLSSLIPAAHSSLRQVSKDITGILTD